MINQANSSSRRGRRITGRYELDTWLDRVREADQFNMVSHSLDQSQEWFLHGGVIRHRTGRFFQIVGLRWLESGSICYRPFIEQREIGTLGFVARRSEEGLELLVHAKVEPGNVQVVQLAPTCQATASNCDRVHGGKEPPYSELFARSIGYRMADSLQSEQGSRFLGKINRNVFLIVPDAHVTDFQHAWIPIKLLKELLSEPFMINTDARSVLCTTPWDLFVEGTPFKGFDPFSRDLAHSYQSIVRKDILKYVQQRLNRIALKQVGVSSVSLEELPGWKLNTGNEITLTNGSLSVRHIQVSSYTREVSHWDQPIMDSGSEMVIDLFCTRKEGMLLFGFRTDWEPGFVNRVELAPSRMVTQEESKDGRGEVKLSVRQSDEGGRFFFDISGYRIVDLGDRVHEEHEDLVWLTLSEIERLLPTGVFTNESRSAISLLLSRL